MEEPVGQKLCIGKIHWQSRAAYTVYGITIIALLLLALWCYHIFANTKAHENVHGNTEIYILKDEVADTGYKNTINK